MTNYVNSIQNFTVTIASGATTGTTTLPTSIIDTALMFWDGTATTATTSMAQGHATLSISVVSGVATITATRLTSSTNTVTMTGCVWDADSTNLVKSVQYVTVTPTAEGTTNTTISSVNTSYAIAHLLGVKSGNATFNYGANTPLLHITTATNLATVLNTRTTSCSFNAIIVEWQPTACNSTVQFLTKSWTNSSTSTTLAVSPTVNPDNTLIFYAGYDNDENETNAGDNMLGFLTSGSLFTISCGVANGDNPIVYNAYLTEFATGVMSQPVQRGTITIAASTSGNNATLGSSVPSTTAGCNFTGWSSTSTATTSLANTEPNVALTSTNTVTADLGGTMATGKNAIIGYEIYAITQGGGGGVTITCDSYFPGESLRLINPEARSPVENSGNNRTISNSPVDTIGNFIANSFLPLDDIISIQPKSQLRLESNIAIQTDRTQPFSYHTRITADSKLPTETLGINQIQIDSFFPLETVGNILRSNKSPLETTAQFTTDRTVPIDTVSNIRIDTTVPVDTSSNIKADSKLPLDTIAQFTQDQTFPLDSMVSFQNDVTFPDEAVSRGRGDTIVPMEAVVSNERADSNVVFEATAQSVGTDAYMPGESVLALSHEENLPGEGLIAIRMDGKSPQEALGNIAVDARIVAESKCGIMIDRNLPYEKLSVITVIQSDTFLPFEVVYSLRRSQRLPADVLITNATDAIMPLESRNLQVVPTSPSRVFNVQFTNNEFHVDTIAQRFFYKTPAELDLWTLDYTYDALNGDTLASSAWAASDPALTVNNPPSFLSATDTSVWIGGGTISPDNVFVTNDVNTSPGNRNFVISIEIVVREYNFIFTAIAKKPAMAEEDWTINWLPRLFGDTIASSAWRSNSPDLNVSALAPSIGGGFTNTTVWLSGGIQGNSYVVTNTITTSSGRILEASFRVFVPQYLVG